MREEGVCSEQSIPSISSINRILRDRTLFGPGPIPPELKIQLNETFLDASNSFEDDRKDANNEELTAQSAEDFNSRTEYYIEDQHNMNDEKMSPVKGREDIVSTPNGVISTQDVSDFVDCVSSTNES